MKHTYMMAALLAATSAAFAVPAQAGWPGDPAKCKPDAVKVGAVCVDKYEASVWQVPATSPAGKSNAGLIKKIQNGVATLAQLNAGGATQIGPQTTCGNGSFPATFPNNGQWTQPLYAASIPGVPPTACLSWLQAQQACGLSRKRLPTNAEWQMAASGTPDPGSADNGTTDCDTNTSHSVNTGSRSGCVSASGAFDMVGNVQEWVADWVPLSPANTCPGWNTFSDDAQCFAGADTSSGVGPGVLTRGGSYLENTGSGPFAVVGRRTPGGGTYFIGFRCAR